MYTIGGALTFSSRVNKAWAGGLSAGADLYATLVLLYERGNRVLLRPLLPLPLKEDTCDEQAWEVRSDAIVGDRMRTREDAARRDAMVSD
jgi:hypothetical protein